MTEPTSPFVHLHRGDAPLLISLPHDGSAIPDAIAARMHPARAPLGRYRLARRPALRTAGRATGRKPAAPGSVALRGRSQPPGGRPCAVSGAARDGAGPDHRLRRRAALPGWPGAGRRGDRAPGRKLLAALSPRAGAGAGAPARTSMAGWCCGRAIRSAARCRCCSKGACRTSISAPPRAPVAAADLQQPAAACLQAQSRYTHVVNGRFKGGYITRQYGQSGAAASMPCSSSWRSATTWTRTRLDYLPERAAPVQALIGELLQACLATP